MTKNSNQNLIEQGIIFSTTGFAKNSNPREYIMPYDKGSDKIVGMLVSVIEKTQTQKTVKQQTPFVPQHIFHVGDETYFSDIQTTPVKLWHAATDYQNWIMNDCKGITPELKEVVDNLCSGRLCLFIGLGGYIFCELDSDAKALITYYQD